MMYCVYKTLLFVMGPFLVLWTHHRVRQGREDPVRYRERFGKPSQKRPKGKIIWFHGASNGECLSFLPVLEAFEKKDPRLKFLVTSGTRTAATLLKKRLGNRAIHQFVPLDHPLFVRRFLDYWQPSVAFRTESDYWPTTILEMKKRGPLVLLNGRLSEKTYKRWAYLKSFFKKMLSSFQIIFPQSYDNFKRYQVFGLKNIKMIGNLKFEGATLSVDVGAVHKLKKEIGRRPLWMASNTHEGEEQYMVDAHHRLMKTVGKNLLLILIPRHKERLPAIHDMLRKKKMTFLHRTEDKKITDDVQVFIVDTMGELGIFYSLTNFVFMAGSLYAHIGGHNVLEPARLGTLPVFGPHMENNLEMARLLLKNKAAIQVKSPQKIGAVVEGLLKHPQETKKKAETVKSILKNINILQPTLDTIEKNIQF